MKKAPRILNARVIIHENGRVTIPWTTELKSNKAGGGTWRRGGLEALRKALKYAIVAE